jgi:hypothetical protein
MACSGCAKTCGTFLLPSPLPVTCLESIAQSRDARPWLFQQHFRHRTDHSPKRPENDYREEPAAHADREYGPRMANLAFHLVAHQLPSHRSKRRAGFFGCPY